MQEISEQLESLEQDGKQYAHFFTHAQNPGYYGIWVRERTPEYIRLWLPHGPLEGYALVLSIEMCDTGFCDYISELFPDQLQVRFLKTLYRIENLTPETAASLANNYRAWKLEKERLNRVKWLEQYPWLVNVN